MISRRIRILFSLSVLGAVTFYSAWSVQAQFSRVGEGKDFQLPLYHPVTNGVRLMKTLITGKRWQMMSNNIVALKEPRIANYREDGVTLEWTAISPECTVDLKTREAQGNTNVVFRTADDRLFLTGVGFLWQHTNSLLILSNQTLTWIDKAALTNTAPK